jgi:hypothetical protein
MEQTSTGGSTNEGKLLPKAVIRAPERRNSKNSWFGTMLLLYVDCIPEHSNYILHGICCQKKIARPLLMRVE